MISAVLSLLSDSSDRDKLRTLYEQYRQPMYRAAFDILKESYLAEDAVHNAFLSAARHLDSIGAPGEPRTAGYLYILARNAAIDIYNSRSRQVPVEEIEETVADFQNVELETESRAVQQHLYELICALDPVYCDILLLKFYHELEDSEIAETLGISLTNARVRLHRAREKLKRMIKEELRHEGL